MGSLIVTIEADAHEKINLRKVQWAQACIQIAPHCLIPEQLQSSSLWWRRFHFKRIGQLLWPEWLNVGWECLLHHCWLLMSLELLLLLFCLFFITVLFYCRDKCIKSFFFLLLTFPIRLLCHYITCKVIVSPLSWSLHWWSKIRQWTLVGHRRNNHISVLFPHRTKPLKQGCEFFVVEISPAILGFSVFT